MRVGIVCEGSTDDRVLRAVCRAVLGVDGLVISPLQPKQDELRARIPGAGTGWQAVRAFLRQTGASLDAGAYDIVVILVDADIRHLPEVAKHLANPADVTLDALCDHVKSWMVGGTPESVVIALPRECIEAWLLAAVTHKHDVESIAAAADALYEAGLLQLRGGRLHKDVSAYEAMAKQLEPMLRQRRKLEKVPELARFVGKLAARAHAIRKGARKGS